MSQANFSAAELAAATGGRWLCAPVADTFTLNTDSRTLRPGECFVPLIGERFNGHDFLDKALEAGASAALVQPGYAAPAGLPVLEVENTLAAYQALAAFHRRRFPDVRIAAVTGSVGKTSVKEMLRAIFTMEAGSEDAVLYTDGNTNNQIGVAQNLLRLTSAHRFAVIEMGTNHHGEIEPLAMMTRADVALVNTIAPCHLEFLGDLNGVAREKSTIFKGLSDRGRAIYPAVSAGNAILAEAAGRHDGRTFGAAGSNAWVTSRYEQLTPETARVVLSFDDGENVGFYWHLMGSHQAVNAAAAAAAAYSLGIEPANIAAGLGRTVLPGKRMNRTEHGGATWINDAYNANPASMKSSLKALHESLKPGAPLLLILGDMLELGAEELSYHEEILCVVRDMFSDRPCRVWLLGPRFGAAFAELGRRAPAWRTFETLEELRQALSKAVHPGDTVFLKSSNSVGLSKVEVC